MYTIQQINSLLKAQQVTSKPLFNYNSQIENIDKDAIDRAWIVIERQVGQFGSRKNQIIKELNKKYGYLAWRLAWQVNNEVYIPFEKAVKFYEEAYEKHLSDNPDKLTYLTNNAQDVYDSSFKNLDSGFDYLNQRHTGKSTHIQDIAIRCVLAKMGLTFQGNKLIQIRRRSKDPIGKTLSPGRVLFHKPELIVQPHLQGWWQENSIEDFWQSNKVIQFNPILTTIHPKHREQFRKDCISG
ncbi:MAG: hypothetical protein HY094_00320 [Candidatus Melainabacteria bacterium]|nr:hypothetical protein [Candidatus Melainabacteria bacterium]